MKDKKAFTKKYSSEFRLVADYINQKEKPLWNVPPQQYKYDCWSHLTKDELIENLRTGLPNSFTLKELETLNVLLKRKIADFRSEIEKIKGSNYLGIVKIPEISEEEHDIETLISVMLQLGKINEQFSILSVGLKGSKGYHTSAFIIRLLSHVLKEKYRDDDNLQKLIESKYPFMDEEEYF